MSKASEILFESFRLLWEEPKLFLPKLVSTFLSSVWILAALLGQLSTTQLLVSFPFIMVLGVFVSLMVASMVKNRKSNQILKEGFLEASRNWKTIIPTAFFFLVTGFVMSIPLAIGLAYFVQLGNTLMLVAGSVLSLLFIVVIGFLSYFLPITLLEKGSFVSGFRKSMQSSKRSSKTVTALTLFSMVLLGLAFASSEYLQTLGYIGFLVGRLLATTVNTYLFVVSPSYYLEKN